jgi:hypothetical protein
MADLDSRNKRGSAIGLDTAGNRVFPNPSGTLASAILRTHVATKYAFGVGAGGATTVVFPVGLEPWLYGLRARRSAASILFSRGS